MSEQRQVRHTTSSNQIGYQKDETASPFKKKFPLKRVVAFVIVCVVLLIVAFVVLFSGLLQVTTVEIEGNQTLPEVTIESQVKNVLNSSPLNANILFVPTSTIEQQLKKDNYQIASANINRTSLNGIKVTITEQKPSILWKSGNTISVFAENGRAYNGEPNETLKRSLPTVVDSSNLPIKTGEKIVSESFVDFVSQLHKRLPEKGVKVSEYQVQETTTELFVKTEAGYMIRFDTTRPLDDQLTDMVAVLDELKKQGKKPAEYIDLRINGRAFYK